MNKRILILLGIIAGLWSCQQEPADDWKLTSLMPYGVPVTIMAPDSVIVKTSDMGGLLKDITVRGGEDYYLQIYATDAETTDISKIKANQLAEVKSNRYFSRIVMEEEPGFIYETQIDSNNINYGFRYIRVQGDKEYIFQTGLTSIYSLEEVERMYEAVKPQER
jgi:hypothetical protein